MPRKYGILIIVALGLALAIVAPLAVADGTKTAPTPATPTSANPDPAGNLVLNGDFQTGDFTDWTQGGNLGYTGVCPGCAGYSPQGSSTYMAFFGPVGSDGTLSQTISDTSGQTYEFSFWVNGNGTGPSDFSAYWNSDLELYFDPVPNTDGWVVYNFFVTGTGDDTISFAFRNDPNYDALDNISLSSGVTPEPASMLLFGSGLLAVGGMLRRRLANRFAS